MTTTTPDTNISPSLLGRLRGMEREDRSVVIAYSMIVLLIVLGTVFVSPNFATPEFLLLQLLQASILGAIAAGQMTVILTGNIDLSVSWTLNLSAVLAMSLAGGEDGNLLMGVLAGLGVGLLVGLVNGIGVAYLRIPSMVLTLGVNALLRGITVVYTGSAPQFQQAPPFLIELVKGKLFGVIPGAIIIWILLSVVMFIILNRSALGRKTYAVGNNEVAAYLSGIRTPRVLVGAFVLSGLLNAFAGILLAGYAGRAFNEMGESYLLPAIAAVVVGGTSILGGSGKYIGTVAGVIIISLLDSALQIMQISPAGRNVTFGLVILAMLLLYARAEKVRE